VSQAVDGGRAEQFVLEGLSPFVEIQVAGDDGRPLLIEVDAENWTVR